MRGKLPIYKCSVCGREVGKLNLKTKIASFKEIGRGGTTARTRTVGWLCVVPHEDGSEGCLYKDPDWNLPIYATSPGMAGTHLAPNEAASA